MGLISPTMPTLGEPNSSADADVLNALNQLVALVNGNIDAANVLNDSLGVDELSTALATLLGVNKTGLVLRGKSITATEQSRTNTAFGPLSGTSGVDATDEVRDVVLPTNGLLVVVFTAKFKSSGAATGTATLMLNGVEVFVDSVANAIREATQGTDSYRGLYSSSAKGLAAGSSVNPATIGTGTLIGGFAATDYRGGAAWITADAGTYDVSVQFKASSGSVTAKERKLWCWTMGF